MHRFGHRNLFESIAAASLASLLPDGAVQGPRKGINVLPVKLGSENAP
jgi:hypothetical protein